MLKLIIISLILFKISIPSKVLSKASLSKGKQLYSICIACHGENGQGKQINNAPRISGQPQWYLERQLINYRDGIRGVHVTDINGLQMRSIAITLKTNQDIEDVAAYITTLKSESPKPTLKGDILAGKNLYVTCQACHGSNGEGNKVLNSPKISGLQDWYITRQLNHFKVGARGRLQNDIYGQQMRPMAMSLNDEQINDLSVYIASIDSIKKSEIQNLSNMNSRIASPMLVSMKISVKKLHLH